MRGRAHHDDVEHVGTVIHSAHGLKYATPRSAWPRGKALPPPGRKRTPHDHVLIDNVNAAEQVTVDVEAELAKLDGGGRCVRPPRRWAYQGAECRKLATPCRFDGVPDHDRHRNTAKAARDSL
ncbi:hypothetical protein FHR32_004995 [Streptosporangium album]|uniref:Uncharacterized protein n=1 Tax=Streptosporangium album TaxID=47479 RepID=A0A7W7WB89_9ACTN|nr:hypothetical protein [Streptosporangium album]MBB4940618.1 hypothetical protein [Streptosporangium album]